MDGGDIWLRPLAKEGGDAEVCAEEHWALGQAEARVALETDRRDSKE